jgi:hypothetical protein
MPLRKEEVKRKGEGGRRKEERGRWKEEGEEEGLKVVL